jgi:neutral amino acid transport system ATP-binding protein
MSHLLALRDVHAGYSDVNILHGVDLYVDMGEIVTVIGPNGAGKSTALKAIMGLLNVRQGTITLRNEDLLKYRTEELIAKRIGYVPQVANVFSSLTVLENLQISRQGRDGKARLEEIFSYFPNLEERKRVRAGRLSGGERQMLALGRALMNDPEILLLDEPSAALSPALTKEVFAKILDINSRGTAILLVEQNARQSLTFSHRAYVLDTGRTALTGTGQELLNDPKVAELYLGGHPKVEVGREESNDPA